MITSIRTNAILPFDVLCHLFKYYEETSEAPLETLLLVCRLWNEAALKSHGIWSDIDIHIHDGPTATFWSRVLPRRLSRSGAASPIYFDLRVERLYVNRGNDDCKDCNCSEIIQAQLLTILKAVVGPDGCLCPRWREIRIDFTRSSIYGFPRDSNFFSHATPNLRRLRLTGIVYYDTKYDATFLPSAPLLRYVCIHCSRIPSLPSTKDLLTLEVDDMGNYAGDDLKPCIKNFSELSHAENVEALRLRIGIRGSHKFNLAPRLPYLKELSLGGIRAPKNIERVIIPNLKILSLDFNPGDRDALDSTMRIINSKNIAFNQITTLIIELNGYNSFYNPFTWTAYRDLLYKCDSVQRICGNSVSTPLLLMLLRSNAEEEDTGDNPGSHLISHAISLSNGHWYRGLRPGRERRLEDIDKLAASQDWTVAVTKDSFLKEWSQSIKVSSIITIFFERNDAE
jgi:hypothetical protein